MIRFRRFVDEWHCKQTLCTRLPMIPFVRIILHYRVVVARLGTAIPHGKISWELYRSEKSGSVSVAPSHATNSCISRTDCDTVHQGRFVLLPTEPMSDLRTMPVDIKSYLASDQQSQTTVDQAPFTPVFFILTPFSALS